MRGFKPIPAMAAALSLIWLWFGCSGSSLATVHKLQFKPSPSPRKISPYIYGFGTYMREDRDQEGIWEMQPTLYRWGGNTSSRFNYKIDAWNAAQDWFWHNYGSSRKGMIDQFMAENNKRNIASMITLPIMGWVAKDRDSYSYPRSLFPKQQQFDGDAGNGLDLAGKPLKADPKRTSIPIDPAFVAGWVQKLKKQFGSHPHFYIMDNEPMLWNSTHRDVHPEPQRYDTYLERYVAFAKAVREADPEAVIIGPAAWGWFEMQYSAYDIEGPWNNWKKQSDRKAHGDKPFLAWFLEQLALREKKLGMKLLDVLDVHYYPEKDRWPAGEDKHPGRQRELLQSTRSLWDPNYKDNSWIDEKIHFIPRLQAMAQKFRPGTPVSIGEYNFRSEYDNSGAIAQADVLGIFARTGLYAAQYWDYPKKDGSHRYAFLLFRNYDGQRKTFGSEWVDNSIGTQDKLSVYAAQESKDKRLTVVIINKTLSEKQAIAVDLKPWPTAKSARLISYQPNAKEEFTRLETAYSLKKSLSIDTPPLSMHLLEVLY